MGTLDSHDKYITFRRQEFQEMMGYLALPPWTDGGDLVGGDLDCSVLAAVIGKHIDAAEIKDAVVIRRQDKFASPCLATYAAMIGLVASELPDTGDLQFQKEELMAIADYFEDQARLSAEEAWKLPDR
jgi:hypothetical protein